MDTSSLRSLTIFSSAIINLMPSLSCCHLLRVLDLQSCNLRDHPNLRFLGNLLHLRYLSLAYTRYGGELPEEIGKLQFLQTLDLSSIEIEQLSSIIIAGLRQLIRLCVLNTRLPNGLLGRLTFLEYLKVVIVDSACMAEELGHLTQLRMLYVRLWEDKDGGWDESMGTALVRSLAKLHKIQKLIVETPNDTAANLEGSLECNLSYLRLRETTSMPTWICSASLPHLSDLDLEMVQVRVEDIRVLGELQSLRYLEVDVSGDFEETGNIQVLERFIVSHDAFPCVIKCSFSGFSMAPSAFQPGAMPSLEEFTFDIRLTDFAGGKFTVGDLALGHLPSLKSVCVTLDGEQDVSKEVLMEVEEKLRHEADVHPNDPGILIEYYG